MKNKKIISLIASTLTVITLTGCNFGKNNINKEDKQKQETQIEKQKENTELDKKSNEETDDKKNIEEEKKDIKKSESEKDKINTESKKESKSNDSSKAKVDGKKKSNQPKPPEKPKYQEKREYKKEIKKEYSKQSSNVNLKPKEKKEPIKKNIPVPKKSIPTPKENIPQAPKQTSDIFISEIEQTIFRKVNEERRKLGIAPLAYNYTMQKYARDKSLDMGTKNYFSHEDLRGKLITENMKRDGVSFNAWGENIGYVAGYTGNANISNQFMNRWMNSTGHRKNILSQNFKSIGIGVYKIGNKYYATQEFYR